MKNLKRYGLIAAAVLLNRIVTVFGDLAAYVFSLIFIGKSTPVPEDADL